MASDHEINIAALNKASVDFDKLAEKMSALAVAADDLNLTNGPPQQSKFEQEIRQLALDRPGMSLATALVTIDSGAREVADLGHTLRDRAVWVLSQPDIMANLENPAYGKIQAIKEVRAQTYLGLKEAKEAVEYAQDMKEAGWLSPAEQEKLEAEAREAIASIQEALQKDV